MILHCQIGNHEWERNGRGRPPANCPEHQPQKSMPVRTYKINQDTEALEPKKTLEDLVPGISETLTEERLETLHCEHGDGHEWQREPKRGKKPKFCPDHIPTNFSSPAKSLSSSPPNQRTSELISEILGQPRAANCRCGIQPGMTNLDLRNLKSCCDPQFVCPTLDTVRRRLNI